MEPIDNEEGFRPPVYIVGAGPGDPELLTIAASKAIKHAELVLYDRLVSDEILALIPESAEAIYVGKLEGEQDIGQTQIFRHLVKAVNLGKRVIRLKGGDPLVFGRGVEEWLFVKDLGCEIKYIPGLSSSIAVPGSIGIPLTARGVSSSFAVLTGQLRKPSESADDRVNWADYSKVETLVILMGVKRRVEIARELIEAGRSLEELVAFIENGTCAKQRIVRTSLGAVAAGNIKVESPAVFVVGEVCKFHDQLFSLVDRPEVREKRLEGNG